jgi:hypothetical protein
MSPLRLLLATLVGSLLLGQAVSAQDQDFFDAIQPPGRAADNTEIGDCVPRPIVGTVPYLNAFEAQKTNAQLFGTVGFFERTMLKPSRLRAALDTDLDLDDDSSTLPKPYWAWEINVIANAVRLASINTGSNCGRSLRYGLQGLDLYAANSALRIPLISFDFSDEKATAGLFYAGGVTASVLQNSNRFFQTYKFAAIGLLGTYAPRRAGV